MIKQQMKELVQQHKYIDPFFPDAVEKHWAMMIEVMTVNLQWTIDYISTASEEETLVSSEVWDDISEFWKSQELISAMEECVKRFPNLTKDLDVSISFAKKALKQ